MGKDSLDEVFPHTTLPPALRRHSPMLGEHTDEVLAWLGRTETEIKALHGGGVV